MHLVPRYINDGTCRMVNSLIKYTDRTRFQVFVGILSRDDFPLQPLLDMGVVPIQLDMKHFADFSVAARLGRILREQHIRILHTHRIRPDLIGRIACRLAGGTVNLSTQHHVGEWDERGKLVGWTVRLLYHLTLPLTSRIVNISHGEMSRMTAEAIPQRLMEVIHNGVDGDVFSPAKESGRSPSPSQQDRPVMIGCVAFLTQRKGIAYLISAVREVVDRHPRTRLVIVGDGEERARLQAQIAALRLPGNVALLGNRRDVAELMNGFDIVVLPSLWEAFGLVLVEAMACGKPVVATAVGGIPEIVEHDRTGILVPARAVTPLAQALTRLIENPELRREMGAAGRRRFLDRFESRSMAARYQGVYETLLRGGKGS